jgi:hypothetical protein
MPALVKLRGIAHILLGGALTTWAPVGAKATEGQLPTKRRDWLLLLNPCLPQCQQLYVRLLNCGNTILSSTPSTVR